VEIHLQQILLKVLMAVLLQRYLSQVRPVLVVVEQLRLEYQRLMLLVDHLMEQSYKLVVLVPQLLFPHLQQLTLEAEVERHLEIVPKLMDLVLLVEQEIQVELEEPLLAAI